MYFCLTRGRSDDDGAPRRGNSRGCGLGGSLGHGAGRGMDVFLTECGDNGRELRGKRCGRKALLYWNR